jgi:cysteine desulfurase
MIKKSENPIYFDNNATTKVDEKVVEAMLPFFSEKYGNPSRMHDFGGQVSKYLKVAREQVSHLLGANDPQEIIFTSCGTESANMALKGTLDAKPQKKHIITTKVEHPCVLNTVKWLEKKGYKATYLSVNSEPPCEQRHILRNT